MKSAAIFGQTDTLIGWSPKPGEAPAVGDQPPRQIAADAVADQCPLNDDLGQAGQRIGANLPATKRKRSARSYRVKSPARSPCFKVQQAAGNPLRPS